MTTTTLSRAKSAVPRWFYSYWPNKVGAGSTISLPPLFVTEVLGGSVADVGLVSSITSAAGVPAAVFWGWLSDRIGTRKLYIILGFLGFGLPTLAMGWADTVSQYLLLSLLVGALSIAGTPVSSTLIMDTVPREEWHDAFGRFNQVTGWGMVAGRVVGLVWITFATALFSNAPAQRWLWVISGGLSILGAFAAWRMVPAPRMPKPRQRPHTEAILGRTGFPLIERVRWLPNAIHHLPSLNPFRLWRRLTRKVQKQGRISLRWMQEPLVAYDLASFALFTASVLAYTPFAVWQRQDLLNTTSGVFMMGMVNSVAAALSYRWVGQQAQKSGSLRIQVQAVALRVLVFGGFALVALAGITGLPSLLILGVLQAVSGLSWAGIAVAGNTTVARLAPKGQEGAAVGAYNSFVSLGAIVGAFISGYLVLWLGFAVVFALGAAGVGITSLMLLWIQRRAQDV